MVLITKQLEEKVNLIPKKPGVYLIKDASSKIIYIGKSKSLRTRVKSYFAKTYEWDKIERMVFQINDIDFIVTDTHLEARLLECELIKKIKPMFNTQFKNHEKYRYLKIEDFNKYKPLSISSKKEGTSYYGPYRSENILLNVVNFFKNIYPITETRNSFDFTYNIVQPTLDEDNFKENKEILTKIFTEKDSVMKFIRVLEKKMEKASSSAQFEIALMYKDIQNYVKYIYENNSIINNDLSFKKLLMVENLDEGYKYFYISNDTILFKKKYKKLNATNIDNFLKQVRK